MGKEATYFAIFIICVVAGAYDVYAMVFLGYEATFSSVLLELAHATPIVPFLFGVLIGHLFWPQKIEVKEKT